MARESFDNMYCSGSIEYQEIGRVLVDIYLNSELSEDVVRFKAAAPAEYRTSFSGSALPFPSERFAFQDSPNQGSIELSKGARRFTIELNMPNSYYASNGRDIVPPYVEFIYRTKRAPEPMITRVYMKAGRVPNRSLTYPRDRTSPKFYRSNAHSVRTQEQILRDSGMHAKRTDFWGARPAR